DFAHHRRGRALEAVRAGGAAARLLDVAPGLGLAARGAAARALGGAEVQLAGEARGIVVVLDARDHRVRAAVRLVLGAAAVVGARSGRLGMSMSVAALAHGRFFAGGGRRGEFRLGAQAFGFRLFLAFAFGRFLGAAAVVFLEALLLGQVALARFLELAQDLGALGILLLPQARCIGRGFGRLDQRDLLAHHHVDRGLVLAAADGDFLLARAVERDLLRRHGLLG